MPRGDGTGPQGKGPGTGRGMGGCRTVPDTGRGTEQSGRFFSGVDFEELKKKAEDTPSNSLSKQQKLVALKGQLNDLLTQMRKIKKSIEEL